MTHGIDPIKRMMISLGRDVYKRQDSNVCNSSVSISFKENTVHKQMEKNIDIDIMSPSINSNKEQNIGSVIPNISKINTI